MTRLALGLARRPRPLPQGQVGGAVVSPASRVGMDGWQHTTRDYDPATGRRRRGWARAVALEGWRTWHASGGVGHGGQPARATVGAAPAVRPPGRFTTMPRRASPLLRGRAIEAPTPNTPVHVLRRRLKARLVLATARARQIVALRSFHLRIVSGLPAMPADHAPNVTHGVPTLKRRTTPSSTRRENVAGPMFSVRSLGCVDSLAASRRQTRVAGRAVANPPNADPGRSLPATTSGPPSC